ncbi:hypothetical protein LCGC14_1109830 [marine sediment metagenome]|uniref:Uncharacterized protein n=1 Tax=marine sediment metagenome TaxID=412755 RepID=A0A0F9MBT4_9ZZZZ
MSDPASGESLAERIRKLLLTPAVAFAIPDDAVRNDIQKQVRALVDEVGALKAEVEKWKTFGRNKDKIIAALNPGDTDERT